MTPTLLTLNIISGVCLLLFGLSLIKTGVQRAFGAELRKLLAMAASHRISAFFTGIIATIFLQSSTATTLLVTSFTAKSMIAAPVALAIIIGAHVGTTLVAQILSFDLSWLAPLLMVTGFFFYSSRYNAGRRKQGGRILIGVALMLMALSFIRQAALPLKDSDILPKVLEALGDDPIFAVMMGGVLAWICYSSLAMVMLVVTLVGANAIPEHLGLMLILGVNVGGVMPSLMASVRDGPVATRLTTADLVLRLFMVSAIFPFVHFLEPYILHFSMDDPGRAMVNAHTAFNLALALVALPFLGVLTKIANGLVRDRAKRDDPSRPMYLDDRALETPVVALTYASREALRIADLVETMMRDTLASFRKHDHERNKIIAQTDSIVDTLYKELKMYLARLGQHPLTDDEQARHFQILTFATNLEHIGDIIDHNLRPTAQKLGDQNLGFSEAGFKEIESLFNKVIDSIRLSQTVFLSADPALARQLIEDKQVVKMAELQTSKNHMSRLQSGIPETLATSGYHMDIIRDLRRVNSLVTSIAYSILEKQGMLHKSVIKSAEDMANGNHAPMPQKPEVPHE